VLVPRRLDLPQQLAAAAHRRSARATPSHPLRQSPDKKAWAASPPAYDAPRKDPEGRAALCARVAALPLRPCGTRSGWGGDGASLKPR
jgi:hypothetical protein